MISKHKNVNLVPEVPKKALFEEGCALTMKNLLVLVLGVCNELEGICSPVMGALIAIFLGIINQLHPQTNQIVCSMYHCVYLCVRIREEGETNLQCKGIVL